eukprot:gnl/TRDRNA2_/TRDRNA2_129179_c0_seq4.p1 gnl/TRDRNA2_/TRDRNA2_129179_c0~~gnl/TRDRNA2_/TRDRNA2_129179_c0_seq4.p1  ORF type:complete len:267 (-),score=72.03 gnl/TRDRNA2_/TRDRNA2_129179_c0_seq4:55-771(-)
MALNKHRPASNFKPAVAMVTLNIVILEAFLLVLSMVLQGCVKPKNGTAFNGGMPGILSMKVHDEQKAAEKAAEKALQAEKSGSKKASELEKKADEKAEEAQEIATKLENEAKEASKIAKALVHDADEAKKGEVEVEKDLGEVKKDEDTKAGTKNRTQAASDAPEEKYSANMPAIRASGHTAMPVSVSSVGAAVATAFMVLALVGVVLPKLCQSRRTEALTYLETIPDSEAIPDTEAAE